MLDKMEFMWYNIIKIREGKPDKPERNIIMKYIDRLIKDYENGTFNNGVTVKARFSAGGARYTYEIDGKFYESHLQGTNANRIITDFIKEHNIKIREA